MKWFALSGDFEFMGDSARFRGGTIGMPTQTAQAGEPSTVLSKYGTCVTKSFLTEGTARMTVRFSQIENATGCEIALLQDTDPRIHLVVGVANRSNSMVAIRQWVSSRDPQSTAQAPGSFHVCFASGSESELKADVDYTIEMRLAGSRVHVVLNDIPIGAGELKSPLTQPLQAGFWCWSRHDLTVSNYQVHPKRPKAFIVMPFDPLFDALYQDVIKPICEKQFEISSVRGDEIFGPGMIIKDITDQVNDATLIIADISPHSRPDHPDVNVFNPNVFFEAGYAFARGKPLILMAKKSAEALPFDVSGFRVLLYEDTIGGKAKVQTQLRKHLSAITGKPTAEDSVD